MVTGTTTFRRSRARSVFSYWPLHSREEPGFLATWHADPAEPIEIVAKFARRSS